MIFLAEPVSLQLKATHKTDATQQNSGQMHFLGADSPTAPCSRLKREVTMVGWLDALCSASDFLRKAGGCIFLVANLTNQIFTGMSYLTRRLHAQTSFDVRKHVQPVTHPMFGSFICCSQKCERVLPLARLDLRPKGRESDTHPMSYSKG